MFARILACLTFIIALLPLQTAEATNWFGPTGKYGRCDGGNRADNATHDFYYSELTSKVAAATTWVRENEIDPTDMTTSRVSSYNNYTDVLMIDQYYDDYCGIDWVRSRLDGGTVGLTTCNAITSIDRCEQSDVRISNRYTEDDATATQIRGWVCHENGHAIGLKHRDPETNSFGCMSTPPAAPGFTSHDLVHINAAF